MGGEITRYCSHCCVDEQLEKGTLMADEQPTQPRSEPEELDNEQDLAGAEPAASSEPEVAGRMTIPDAKLVKRETSILSDSSPHSEAARAIAESGRPQTARLAQPWRLLLQIGGETQTTVGVEVKEYITLGRSDPVANFYPELDLTPYGGQERGVSRRHASILQDNEHKALYIEDLSSTNGTRINGFALEPRRRYRLRDGDEVELGRVRVVLRFVRSPYK